MGEIYALPKAVSNKISGEDVTPIHKITNSDINLMTYLVPERKPCSGTILDFGFLILD